jgi:hypothetical protein
MSEARRLRSILFRPLKAFVSGPIYSAQLVPGDYRSGCGFGEPVGWGREAFGEGTILRSVPPAEADVDLFRAWREYAIDRWNIALALGAGPVAFAGLFDAFLNQWSWARLWAMRHSHERREFERHRHELNGALDEIVAWREGYWRERIAILFKAKRGDGPCRDLS